MTADMNANANVNCSTTEMEDKHGLDMSGCEDLMTPATGFNGFENENENESEKGNREDDPDASYVFVGGNGVVSDEPADTANLNDRSESVDNVGSPDVKVDEGAAELVVDHGDGDVKCSAIAREVDEGAAELVVDHGDGDVKCSAIEREVDEGAAELVVDHGDGDVKCSAIERDAGSPMKNEAILNDENGGENGSVEVPNGAEGTVGAEVHCLDDHGEVEVEHDELALNTVVEGTQELQTNVPGAVDSSKALQVCISDEKAEVEDNIESIVAQESQVTNSTDITELEPNHNNADVASFKNVPESEWNQFGETEVTRSSDIAESEQNQSGNVEVTDSIINAELVPIQSGNTEDMVEGEIKLFLVSTMREHQVSPIIITESIQNDNGDLDQGKELLRSADNFPVKDSQDASELELVQEIEGTRCLVEADVKLESSGVVDSSLSDEYSNGVSVGCAGDSTAETCVVNGIIDACQNPSIRNSAPEMVGRNEMLSPDDAENAMSLPAASDDDASGGPKRDMTTSVGQLESETISGHITHQEGETLPSNHAEGSDLQIITNESFHACQTTCEKNKPSEGSEPAITENAPFESHVTNPVDSASDTVLEAVPEDDAAIYKTGTETLDEKLAENSSEGVGSQLLHDREVAIHLESYPLVNDKVPSSPDTDSKPESRTDAKATKSEEVSALSSDEVKTESEFSGEAATYVGSIPVLLEDQDRKACMPDSVQDRVDVKAQSEAENSLMVSREVSHDDALASESQVVDGSVTFSEGTIHYIQKDLLVENRGNEFISIDSDGKTNQERDVTDVGNQGEASASIPEGSAVDTSDEQNVMVEVGIKPFYYMVKIPRYDDHENLKEQIKQAQNQVDEKTKTRDAIRAEMQKQRATCNEYGACVDTAISEEIAARDLLKAKRKDIDSVLSVINKVRSVRDVGEIDGKIRNMEHMLQHETLPLKEEKNYIRAIQQLKQTREQLSSNLGKQEDVQEAINQKEQVEERLKSLRKEADLLRENVLKAEGATKNAKKKYQDEHAKLNELTIQFRAADDVRQQAYADLQSLRKQLYEKNKHFWKYKDDAKAAIDLASKGDKELHCHCVNQVERIMELWNNNDEFRKDYVRCNIRSTLRRLRTFDGRSLGPDEEPPAFPNVSERVANDNAVPSISALKEEKTVAPKETEKKDDKSVPKVGDQMNPIVKNKKPAKRAPPVNGLATVSGRNEVEEALQQEDNKLTREEEELLRKAEELRKEEEAAMLKEQRRLEEKAKAKEAMERKKRIADKAQARAALRAQKEAEQKEKEREKRARKKEKRKAIEEDVNVIEGGESAPSVENPPETKVPEVGEKPMNVKRSWKPSHYTKQTKLNSPPVPLRNRSKRRMQTWIWLLTALPVVSLFLFGNGSFSLQRFGF